MNETARRIKSCSIDLFASSRYEKVSVANICRVVGIANSVFYYYYASKEVLYRELLGDLFSRLDDAFGSITGSDSQQRLTSLLSILLQCGRDYEKEIAIYREGEFRYPEFDHALKAIYHSALEIVFQRPVSQAEYYFFSGGIRFLTRRFPHEYIDIRQDQLRRIISSGIFHNPDNDAKSVPLTALHENQISSGRMPESSFPEKDAGGSGSKTTREKMLEAGILLFGQNGYDQTQVFHIAQSCGYSVGMFYKLFPDKTSFLEEIVDYINRELRSFIEPDNLVLDAVERETVRLSRYLEYFQDRNHIHNILREAEFAAPEAMNRYYMNFNSDSDFTQALKGGIEAELAGVFLRGIAHYLGAELLTEIRTEERVDITERLGQLLNHGMAGID